MKNNGFSFNNSLYKQAIGQGFEKCNICDVCNVCGKSLKQTVELKILIFKDMTYFVSESCMER